MSKKDKLGVKIFVASATGQLEKAGYTKDQLEEANKAIQLLASEPTPENRYQIAQIMSFVVDDLIAYNENAIKAIADVKNVSMGDAAEFKVRKNEITAYVQAKGGTPFRSKIVNDVIPVTTYEISARPYVNFSELASGRVDFTELMVSAANEMTLKKIKIMEDALKAGVTALPNKATASGTEVVRASFNELFFRFARQGKTRVLGDVALLNKLSEFSGFDGVNNPSDLAQEEIRKNAHVGTYLGATVHRLENPAIDSDLNPLLSYNALYVLTGNESPLKFVNEGNVESIDQTNADDNSYEVILRQRCGAALAIGRIPTLGVYTVTE